MSIEKMISWFHQIRSSAFKKTGASNLEDSGVLIASAKKTLIATENYFLEIVDFGTPTLVVTFEPAGLPADRPDPDRPGWGAKSLQSFGISHLCVKPKKVDWYRKPDLAAAFSSLREQGFFSRFERVVIYGGSMGGFAALAYADHIGAHSVLALNPQSTLCRDKVPWEKRFGRASAQDWTGPFSDAADGLSKVQMAYVVVDRMCAEDWGHITRLPQARLTVFNIPFVGHQVPAHLQLIGMLKPLLLQLIDDTFDMNWFAKSARQRRKLQRYFNVMTQHPRVVRSDLFTRIVSEHKAKSDLAGAD